MNDEIEKKIIEAIPKLQDKLNILHFSTGVDSVVSYLRLKEFGIKPILIYKYFLPDIPMVMNYIDWFERKYNERVYLIPNTLFYQHIDNALYQFPIYGREDFRNNLTPFLFYKEFRKKSVDKKILKAIGLKKEDVVFHVGVRYTDGLLRYLSIQKNGVWNKDNTFFPIASFKVNDLKEMLDKYECKLPIEYKLFGISFESLRSWNIGLIRQECPASYEYMLQFFPMVKLLEYRDKFNTLNKHFKIRVTQFKDYAIDKSLYDVW